MYTLENVGLYLAAKSQDKIVFSLKLAKSTMQCCVNPTILESRWGRSYLLFNQLLLVGEFVSDKGYYLLYLTGLIFYWYLNLVAVL